MTPSIVEEIDFVGMFLNDFEDESNFRNSLINGSESERVVGPPFPKNFTNFSIENREKELLVVVFEYNRTEKNSFLT
jgi:hypothetical protein